MSDLVKILAQLKPTSAEIKDLYTVPTGRTAVISSVIVCNQGSTDTIWRMSIAVSGAVDEPKQYIYYDVPHVGNDTFVASIGLTLSQGDIVRVYSGNGNLSFNLCGIEET